MWQAKWNQILRKITLIQQEATLRQTITQLSHPNGAIILAFVNAHAMNTLISNDSFYQALLQADIIYRDGSGMAKLYRHLGIDSGLNLNGTDLIPQILHAYSDQKIALYGTQTTYLEQAKKRLLADGISAQTAFDCLDGFQPTDSYVQRAQEERPNLIVLAMGMPKQEQVAVAIKASIDYPCLIVCGGAIVDFLGGKVQRAPIWMRNMGIEWVYRLLIEPKRMFKRYVIGNLLFMARVKRLNKTNKVSA